LCKLSNNFLKMALYDEVKRLKTIPNFNVKKGNSLFDLDAYRSEIDIIVCNPPYRKILKKEKLKYMSLYGDIIQGQPNYYSLFILLGIKLLKENGVCGLVTPTSY